MQNVLKTAALTASILAAAACGGGGATTTNGAGASGSASTHASTTSSAGAGGGSSSTGAGGSGPSDMMACADQAHAACEEREKCSLDSYENDLLYGSEATCESRSVLNCVHNLMAKGTAQTTVHIEQCVAAYPGYACNDFYDNNPSGPCVPPVGTLAKGAPCGASGQCASSYCALGPYVTCGTCQPLPAVGDPCQNAGECGRNLGCVKPAGSTAQDMGTCAAFVPMGGECLTNVNPCEAGFTCVGDDTSAMTTGKCQAAATAVGDACDASRKTMQNCYGEKGLVCVPTSAGTMGVGTCQAIQLVAAGMPCGAIGAKPITGFADCEAGGACIKGAAADATGRCAAPAPDGTACDSDITVGPPCLPPAKCVPDAGSPAGTTAGTCTVPDATKCG